MGCTCHKDGTCRCLEIMDETLRCKVCGAAEEHCGCGCVCQGPLIVTRHPGAADWLALHGVLGETIAHASAEDVRGRVVYGVLPLHLAAEADEVWSIDLPDLVPSERGRDLSPAEMDVAGARLVGYRVTRIG